MSPTFPRTERLASRSSRSSIATSIGRRAVAARHGVARVHAGIEDLLDDKDVALVDIAVPASLQPEIALRALEAGKDVICQKPLALDLGAAQRIVDRAAQLGRKVAVQQQLRFEEGIAATRAMTREGWIGEPTAVSFSVDVQTDFSAWSWLVEAPKLELYYHSIHYLDAIRALIGEPLSVFGTQSRRPGQVPRGETRTISTLIYPGDLRADRPCEPREPERRQPRRVPGRRDRRDDPGHARSDVRLPSRTSGHARDLEQRSAHGRLALVPGDDALDP